MLRPAADHEFLAKIAGASGGQFALADERKLASLLEDLVSQRDTLPRPKVEHLRKPQIISAQFAPVLSRASAGGREDVMRETIADGTPRMPGFKYNFDSAQIAAIVSRVRR